ncbi:SDR family NAD(P)-dependent oxidoreductase [Sphingobacterium psychroaquaticum]|uniref:Enoyl-(Acyl carrier protein) reductase n=1 Tax=Sphingobacterium psychroaquaticum TaxID=561061 RepID=A0A1X7JSL6_9SPHI|nr:SDR family oxidoreductase [Sphingobacterium psychroaquaticum]QBQ40983.1 SDR family oxidoreductase [Sphingobacterium psychroaquaticum]SMG30579.1 Enoyl-(Acyl carrier protein) reductase [Sphingobacterium psychroaquaticum]
MIQEFKDKVVVISGGLGDIGRAIAQAFLAAEAIVCIGDKSSMAEAIERWPFLGEATSRVSYHTVDVADPLSVETWITDCRKLYGGISICIANAARVTLKKYSEISNSEWKDEMGVNLDGAFFVANTCARAFVTDKIPGNIVFLGSWAAHAVHENLPAYSVSKAAVRMLCQTMALEYAAQGIRVNEIAPGYVNAGLSKVVWSKDPRLQTEAAAVVPLGTILESEEIADQVLWMCSSACRQMTGASIVLDGGLSLIRP